MYFCFFLYLQRNFLKVRWFHLYLSSFESISLIKSMKKIIFALATLYAVECTTTGCHYVPPPPPCNGNKPQRERRSVPSPPKVHVNVPKFPKVPKPNNVPSVHIPNAPRVPHVDRPSIDLSYSNTLRKPNSPDAPRKPNRPNPRMPRSPSPKPVTIKIRENSTGRKALSNQTRRRNGSKNGNSRTRGNSQTGVTSRNTRTNSPGTNRENSRTRQPSRPHKPPVVCGTAPKPVHTPAPKPVNIPGRLGCSTCGSACGSCDCKCGKCPGKGCTCGSCK